MLVSAPLWGRNWSRSFVSGTTTENNGIPKIVHSFSPGKTLDSQPRRFRVVQVQIVHRHGDRTPITPLKNESYWAGELPSEDLLQKVAKHTKIRRDTSHKPHLAGGRGAFGKLTQLGLLQMIGLGGRIREELHSETKKDALDDIGNVWVNRGRIFDPSNPIHPRHVKVVSTDFARTLQSVQGTLVGLFPDPPTVEEDIEIDARHTQILIPDPQPRQTTEQVHLENVLAARPHLQEREGKMKGLAVRTTEALKPFLGDDAFQMKFGVGEEGGDSTQTLSWVQLAEITKCLQVRSLLPPSISEEDLEAISAYTAWRWFENMRHPRLAYLAMNKMVSRIVESMGRRVSSVRQRVNNLRGQTEEVEAAFHLYSAHDSTLIGLLSAFRLEQPAKWPEYGSYFKIELIEVAPINQGGGSEDVEYFVRFSLNGEVLRSFWEGTEPCEAIPFEVLVEKSKLNGIEQ